MSRASQSASLPPSLSALSVKSVFLTRPSSATPSSHAPSSSFSALPPPQRNPSYKLSGTCRRHRPTLKLDLSLSLSLSLSLPGRAREHFQNRVIKLRECTYTQYTHSNKRAGRAMRWSASQATHEYESYSRLLNTQLGTNVLSFGSLHLTMTHHT